MSAIDTPFTDLIVIKGIGPVRQQWLREALHVHTLQDLAALSPDAIEAQLKAEGRTAVRSEIESWIAQAQKLTDASAPSPVPLKASVSASRAGAWQAFAQFGVEFQERTNQDVQPPAQERQTAVRHIETGRTATWPGLESRQLCEWMLEQIGANAAQEIAKAPVVAPSSPLKRPLKVMLTQARVFQPPEADAPIAIGQVAQPMQGIIKSVDPFALEVAFELAEPITGNLAAQIAYHAQCHIRHQFTGVSTYLGNTETGLLVAGQSAYRARLPSITLLTGLYRVQLLVSLQSRPPSLAYAEIPLLQVV